MLHQLLELSLGLLTLKKPCLFKFLDILKSEIKIIIFFNKYSQNLIQKINA